MLCEQLTGYRETRKRDTKAGKKLTGKFTLIDLGESKQLLAMEQERKIYRQVTISHTYLVERLLKSTKVPYGK